MEREGDWPGRLQRRQEISNPLLVPARIIQNALRYLRAGDPANEPLIWNRSDLPLRGSVRK